MANTNDFERFNAAVGNWADQQVTRMTGRVAALTLKDKHALRKAAWHRKRGQRPLETSIGASVKTDAGLIERVNIRLPRHGIFLERGVGRGRKANTASVRPKEFIAPVLDPGIEDLANIIAEGYADIGAGEIKFNVPGVILKRVKLKINNG